MPALFRFWLLCRRDRDSRQNFEPTFVTAVVAVGSDFQPPTQQKLPQPAHQQHRTPPELAEQAIGQKEARRVWTRCGHCSRPLSVSPVSLSLVAGLSTTGRSPSSTFLPLLLLRAFPLGAEFDISLRQCPLKDFAEYADILFSERSSFWLGTYMFCLPGARRALKGKKQPASGQKPPVLGNTQFRKSMTKLQSQISPQCGQSLFPVAPSGRRVCGQVRTCFGPKARYCWKLVICGVFSVILHAGIHATKEW